MRFGAINDTASRASRVMGYAKELLHAVDAELVDILVSHVPQISNDVARSSYNVVHRHSLRVVDLRGRNA